VDDIPWTKLVRDGIRGAMQGLDADSALVLPAQSPPLSGATAAADGDVGLALTRRGGGLGVVAAREGMPARSAGLRSGDRIVTIEGADVRDMMVTEAAERLRGRPGTAVTLTIARSGWLEPQSFTLTRVKPPAFAMSERSLGDGILYVRMPAIDDATAGELKHLLQSTSPERASGLVLDVKNTPGGSVEAARAVASLFLAPGCLVAKVESRIPGQPLNVQTAGVADPEAQPMAILVDRGTASAAEVLVGALQDSGRAVVIGSRTFGDASAQSTIPLPDGSALSLTTARYLTPEGRAITGKGIIPDLVAKTPASTSVRAAASTAGPGEADAQRELAFEVVKAARILQHGSSAGGRPSRVEAMSGGCGLAPAQARNG